MARTLVTGSVPSTAVVGSPVFSASVPCHIPDGFPVYKPKHGSGFLRAQLLLQMPRPSRVIALVAPSALYCRSLSSSYSVQKPRSAGCLRLGLSILHGFELRRSAQERRLAGGDSFETQASSPRCMAASTEKDLEKWIKKTNSSEPVVVWSKTYCPYSIRVKKLFDKLGYDFQAVELDEIAEEGLQDALERVSGLSTVPNVYIGGKHIGGCDDTVTLHMRSELVPLLTAAGANKKDLDVLLLRPHVEIGATTTGSGECKDDFQLSMVDMIKDQQPAMDPSHGIVVNPHHFVHCVDVMILALPKTNVTDYTEKFFEETEEDGYVWQWQSKR